MLSTVFARMPRNSAPPDAVLINYANAPQISVHTEEHNRIGDRPRGSGGPRSGMVPGLDTKVTGHQGARVSRHAAGGELRGGVFGFPSLSFGDGVEE